MSVRAEAVRRAAQVRAERATRIAAREERIGSCLAEYFAATARGEQVTAAARRRCAEIMAQSRTAVGQCRDSAAGAVRELEGLGLNRADIAEMTGLGLREVRYLLAPEAGPVAGDLGAEVEDPVLVGSELGGVPAPSPHPVAAVAEIGSAPGAGSLPGGPSPSEATS